ncbi:MAG: low molecular weight protein arginine phosphatase [Tissierella sp.]|nr:low molecular weight protein arginine phosphatase [Tissierella sp.]
MKVLFICTGNTCRSPMAEGLLKDLSKKKGLGLEVQSAGVFAMDGDAAAINAVQALNRVNIDISDHKSQSVSKGLVDGADLILTMSKSHKQTLLLNHPHVKDKVFLLNEYALKENKDIQDPFGRDLCNYERTRDEILKALNNIKW